MLPHFPALLLLLVSPGGADHPPHPPWKELFRRLPSPREEVVSSRDKYEQKTFSWSGSSTTPEVKTTDQVLLAVSGHQIIPSVKDRHDKVFPDQLTLRSPAARDQQASESMGGSQEKSSASPYFSFPGPRQRMFAPDSLPAFPAGINKHHPLIKRSRRESRRNRSRTANKTLVIRLINDVSQRKSPVNRKQVHQVAYKRCAGGSKRDFLTNDTSSETCLGVITSTDPKQTTSSKFDVQDPGDNTSPSTGNVLFVSKGLTNKALKNGIASQEHQTDIINIRGNLTSRKTTGINTEAVLSRGDTAGHERPHEMTSRLRQGSGGSETIREEGDAHFSNSLSDSTFRNVLTKTYSSGSVGAAEQRREHLEPHQKSAVVVKGSDVAHLRHKMGERRGVVPRLPGELMAPVTSATKHHISGMLGSNLPYADTSLKTIPSVQTQGKDSFVYNRSFATSNSRGNSVQTLYFENKSVNSWRKHSRVKENRKVPHTSGVNNKKSNDSLFRVDRTDREDGESVEVPWVTWHKKRDTEEAQKNEFVLVNAQAGGGHSEMAVSQERDQRNNVDESRKNRVVRSINAGCKDTENVVCTAKVFPDNHNNNKLDTINDPGHVNADGPSRLRDDNSPGIPLRFLYKPNENDGTDDSESFRRRMEEDSVPAVVEVPVVRHRRERWSSVPRPEPFRLDHLRNHTIALPAKYSRIFTKNFPQIFSNYHSDAMNKRNHQSEQRPQQPDQEPSDDKRAVAHGSVADIKQDRKANRPLSLHANRSSVRAKGGNKHTRGERSFVKTPQQRHARSRNRAKRKVPAREVWALAGDDALLPCDLSVRDPKDSVQMVMWLREGTHTPLFSVDYRERTGDDPQTWRDNSASTAQRAHMHVNGVDLGLINSIDFAEQSYGGRVTDFGYGESMSTSHLSGSLSSRVFGNRIEDIDSQESATLDSPLEEENIGLVVKDVELNDTAVYRCRVDFLLTPTRNSRVNFTVVVPPLHVGVRWWMGDRGDSVINNEAGPFREGDSPTLICFTRDAWPPPRVVWFEEDVLVDDTYTMDPTNEAVENTLLLKHLTRTHHHRRFTCVAANSNLTKPIAATVHIQMALDVLNVEMDEVGVLSAGVQAEVKCTVWGSSPPPIVTWTLAGSELASAKPWVSDDGNRSVSMVSFTPQPRHDGTQLECSAHNPVITSTPAHRHPNPDNHHSSVLTVNYAPRVSVTLGRSLDAANIKEGDDLYFECAATAKPPPHKVTWSHNQGGHLESSPGILVSNMTLVLQKVARSNAGSYTCHATNTEGSAASPPVNLDVKYAPVCATDTVAQHSVAKHENARISCNVLANPPVVHFSWAFNNTAEAVSVPTDRYVVMGTESVVNYTPVTELDYGTLLCWAKNAIGTQVHPCVFQIVAAGKPDPPHNCRAYDVTISSLQVSCLPGDDGGLGQTFLLRVLEANGDFDDVAQVTRETASFSVANLRPATAYRLLVTATNAKGESRPAELRAYTVALNHPQHETPAEPTRGRESGAEVAVGVLVGAVLACLPVAIAVVVMGVRTCMRLRAARRGRTAEESEKYAAEMEAGSTGRPLLTGQGTPGSGGGGSAESGSDITTITGGVAISSSTMPPTPSSGQSDTQVTQVSTTETSNLLYPAGRLYSPDRAQEVVGPQVLTANAANLRRGPYNPLEEKFDGDNELLEITLPPPAAYDQGYQSSYPGCQPRDQRYQTQEQGPQRLKQGYQQAFREYQPVLPGSHHLPAAAYPAVAIKGGHPSLQYISSAAMTQDYHFPSKDPTSAVTKVTGSSSFATLPHSKVTSSSSFATLPINKDAGQDTRMDDPKMSTLYNPLAMFASSPSYAQKCGSTAGMSERGLTTGSLKRGVKPQGQDVLRIRDNPRNRSASLSSVTSKRESSV